MWRSREAHQYHEGIGDVLRARSDASRAKALEEYLKRKDMTMADFHELERLAARPFYLARKTARSSCRNST